MTSLGVIIGLSDAEGLQWKLMKSCSDTGQLIPQIHSLLAGSKLTPVNRSSVPFARYQHPCLHTSNDKLKVQPANHPSSKKDKVMRLALYGTVRAVLAFL